MRLTQPAIPDQPLDDKEKLRGGNELSSSTKETSIRARENKAAKKSEKEKKFNLLSVFLPCK